jgi:two-component system NtrC family sensor kinase
VTDHSLDVLGDIVEGLPVAVYRTSPAGRFLAGNTALLEMLGVESFDDLASLQARDIYADPARRDWLLRRAEAGLPIPVEDLQIRRRDGGLRWVRVSSHTIRDDDDEIVYFEGVMEDVTTLHAVDAQLRRSNELLDTLTRMQDQYVAGADVGPLFDGLLADLLEATGSAYGFIAQVLEDDGGRFLRTWAMTDISWNEATREMFRAAGPQGMEFHNLDTLFGRVVTTEAPVISNAPLQDSRAAGRPYGHPPLDSFLGVPILRAGGVMGMVALANREGGFDEEFVHFLAPLTATVGSLMEAVTADRDRAQAERRQAHSKALHRLIVERAADAIVTFTDDGRIVLANAAARSLVNAAHVDADVLGAPITRFLPPDSVDESRERARQASADGKTVDMQLLRRDGAIIDVEASFVRGRYDDEDVTTVIARDIESRKATEAALRVARDIAESTARAKDELLAGMSHELRTPLNAVIGLSSILHRELHGPLTDKQRAYVEQIENSGRHLLAVINGILDLAKAEASKLTVDLRPADVGEIIRDAVGLSGDLAVGKGLTVTRDPADGLPDVEADPVRARQVLLNLLSNAVKFTPSGGRVAVRAAVRGPWVDVSVADTGIGIAADDLERIFEPFEQADSSLARHYEGTGLGLALSRSLMELMGGTLAVRSEPGHGAEFTASFRRADAASARNPRD